MLLPEAGTLAALAAATTLADAETAVARLLELGYTWFPLGAKEGNFGLVNIGSDPAIAFVERVTNAIDAVIERRALSLDDAARATLESPHDAAHQLFGIPDGGTTVLDLATAAALARDIVVTVRAGSAGDRPVLDVRDRGVGLDPDEFPNTILNLAGSNKLAKPYLAGAYGQGGSTTFAFSPRGTTIVSTTETSDIGVTFVRFRELDPRKNKNGRYDYLARSEDGRGNTPGVGRFADSSFEAGTLVRHFDYELVDGRVDAVDREHGLAAVLERTLFDPVLPFTVVETRPRTRNDGSPNPCVLLGRRAALERAPQAEVPYRQSASVVLRARRSADLVALRYWILADDDSPLHPDRRAPLTLTNVGQTHGTEDRRFITETLKLPYLKSVLVVQADVGTLSPTTKRELLSSTRDRLKRGRTYDGLMIGIRDALLDDAALQAANAERRRRLLERHSAADQQKLRRRFAELMEKFRAGSEPATKRSDDGASEAPGGAAHAGEPRGVNGEIVEAEPLPTLEHPTFVRIAVDAPPIAVPEGRTVRLALESDAPDGYVTRHEAARIVLAFDPPSVAEFLRATDFRGGRARATFRVAGATGMTGSVTVRFADAAENVHADAASIVVVPAPPPASAEPSGTAGGRVPEIVQVFRPQWDAHGFDERSVANVNESTTETTIFVNMDNVHLVRLLHSTDYQETGLSRMRSSYLVQAAFYGFLLHEAMPRFTSFDAASLDAYQRDELDRVARTVVTAIASVERIESPLGIAE